MKLHPKAQHGAQCGAHQVLPILCCAEGPHSLGGDSGNTSTAGKAATQGPDLVLRYSLALGLSSVHALPLRRFHCSGTDI